MTIDVVRPFIPQIPAPAARIRRCFARARSAPPPDLPQYLTFKYTYIKTMRRQYGQQHQCSPTTATRRKNFQYAPSLPCLVVRSAERTPVCWHHSSANDTANGVHARFSIPATALQATINSHFIQDLRLLLYWVVISRALNSLRGATVFQVTIFTERGQVVQYQTRGVRKYVAQTHPKK